MLSLIRTKACKRCGGDLSLECDIYGVYVECIQCGGTWTGKDMITAHAQAVNDRQVARRATPVIVVSKKSPASKSS
jgi:hypothetical protein